MALQGPLPEDGIGPRGLGEHAPLPPRPRQPGRARRWVLGMVAGLLGVLAIVVLGTWLLLSHLEHPWVKPRLLALVRSAAGLSVDYDDLEVSLSDGVRAKTLRLLTPPKLAGGAENFVRVEDLELRTRLWALPFGDLQVDALRVGGLDVAIVRDESGATTLSDLFPPEADDRADAEGALSRSLEKLPRLSVDTLDVSHLRVRLVELRAQRPPRITRLATLGVRGTLQSSGEGLAGTRLRVAGAPALRLEQDDGSRVRQAQLGLELGAQASDAGSVAWRLSLDLGAQDFAPAWTHRGRLLELAGDARFDAPAAKTAISIEKLRVLGEAVAADARAEVFDPPGARVVTSGRARVRLAALPFAVEGVSLAGLEFDLNAQELTWDGQHITGRADWKGRAHGLDLRRPEGSARVDEVSWVGQGAFDERGGNLAAKVDLPSLAWQSPEGSAELSQLSLDLNGTASEPRGAQRVDANAGVAWAAARWVTAGQRLDLQGASLEAHAKGTVEELAQRAIPELEGRLHLARGALLGGGSLAVLQDASGTASVAGLEPDATAAFGARGAARLEVTLPSVLVYEGQGAPRDDRRAPTKPRGRPALSAESVRLQAALPLSLERVTGTLSLHGAQARQAALRAAAFDIDLTHPLGWSLERAGTARASVRGRLGSFGAGGSRGALDKIQVMAQRLEGDRYELELDAAGSARVAQGAPVGESLSAQLRAEAAPRAGTLRLLTGLRTARGATLDAEVDVRFERAREGLSYRAQLSADRLESLASLAQLLPNSARAKISGARLEATAEGDFSGVLRANDEGLPVPTPSPLTSARGSQNVALTLHGLDYRAPGHSLAIPELALDLRSVHGAAGGGSAHARIRAKSLAFEGGGTAVRLAGLDQRVTASFDRAPQHGLVDVHTALELASAAQPWVPAYPLSGLRLVTHLQVERLRSIFLRELVFDNAEASTSLFASGALELRAQGTTTSPEAMVGREALSFEGRLEQDLAPLQQLGLASRASGRVAVPFRLESGGLLGYRLLAALEASQVSFALKDRSLAVERLNGVIPIVEEFALLPSGPVLSAGPRESPLSDTRFFDIHPFLTGDNYVTADSITVGGRQTLGPLAANVRIERTDFLIDQLQVGYRGGQITGQARVAYRDGDPIVRMRLNATGLRSGRNRDPFDANAALTFVPGAMTLDGKLQIVRASRGHLLDVMDVLDPYHESANANRIRQALALGYPKFVRFQLHDGAVDTKVELGGIAKLVRIDEIRAVPLGPIMQRYVAPTLAGLLRPRPREEGLAFGESEP